MTPNPYSEDHLIDQPAMALLHELDWPIYPCHAMCVMILRVQWWEMIGCRPTHPEFASSGP